MKTYRINQKRKQRRENVMLKKKIAAMQGQSGFADDLPVDIQNAFMQTVLEYEEQFAKKKKTRIIDKISNPDQFKKISTISEKDIEGEWIALYDHLYSHGIDLQVCSPNVSARELYRFATEELFGMKIDDISIPGMMTCFIYDEFYPDHAYENRQTAVDDCIRCFLSKKELYDYYFTNTVRFNDHARLRKNELVDWVRVSTSRLNKTDDLQITVSESKLLGNQCRVNGTYKKGNWLVEFIFEKKSKSWKIFNVQIEGMEK